MATEKSTATTASPGFVIDLLSDTGQKLTENDIKEAVSGDELTSSQKRLISLLAERAGEYKLAAAIRGESVKTGPAAWMTRTLNHNINTTNVLVLGAGVVVFVIGREIVQMIREKDGWVFKRAAKALPARRTA